MCKQRCRSCVADAYKQTDGSSYSARIVDKISHYQRSGTSPVQSELQTKGLKLERLLVKKNSGVNEDPGEIDLGLLEKSLTDAIA